MRRIDRAAEPAEFARWRAEHPVGTWDELRALNRSLYHRVADVLAGAQGQLCAYCELRLVRGEGRRVAHLHPKSDRSDHNWHLDFQNLLACCSGGTLPPGRRQLHCDAKQGNRDLTGIVLDPRELPADPIWKREAVHDGDRLLVDEDACRRLGVDPARARATLEALGLNVRALTRHRGELVDELDRESLSESVEEIASRHMGPLPSGELGAFWTTVRLWCDAMGVPPAPPRD